MGYFDWIGNAGTSAYNWAGDNPLGALSLGMGAAGTGFGIWDAMQAQSQQQQIRDRMQAVLNKGPQGFMPNWSPGYLQEQYLRPAASFMAQRGQSDGGAFRQALADASVKAEGDRYNMGLQQMQAQLAGLGGVPQRQATGGVGGLGQSLQMLQLLAALRNRGGQTPQGTPSQGAQPYGSPYGTWSGVDQYKDWNNPSSAGNFYNPGGGGDQFAGFSMADALRQTPEQQSGAYSPSARPEW